TPLGSALAGTGFALGGYMTQVRGFVNIFSGFVWLPAVFACVCRSLDAGPPRRRAAWVLAAGTALALSFLAGHHVPPIQTGLLLGFYVVFRVVANWRGAGWRSRLLPLALLAGVALWALLLASMQWLPSLEWGRLALRWVSEGEPIRWGEKIPYSILQQTGSLSPQSFVSLVLPYVSVDVSLYVGAPLLFLALVGLLFARPAESRFFAAALFLYLFLSWGELSVVHGWVNTFIPGVWFAREVFHYLVPLQLCLALLAGWGLDALAGAYGDAPDPALVRFVRRAGWGLAGLVAGCGALVAALHIQHGVRMDHPHMRSTAGLAVYAFALGVLLFFLHSGRIAAARFAVIAVALVGIDLASNLSREIRAADRTAVQSVWRPTPAVEFLRARARQERFRVDDSGGVFPPNFGDAWRLESTMGHGATGLARYLAFRGTGWGAGSNATALLGARYFVARIPVPGMPRVFEGPDPVYRNPRAVPRAFAVTRYRVFASDPELLKRLETPLFAPRATALVLQGELGRVPQDVRAALNDEGDGLEVSVVTYKSAAGYGPAAPPWGWTSGDELMARVRPAGRLEHCFLRVDFYPTGAGPSRLDVALEGAGRSGKIAVELPGRDPEEAAFERLRTIGVDLGALEAADCRVTLRTAEASGARIDSLGFFPSPAGAGDDDPGPVRLRAFQPNRLELEADLRRAALVVCSEVFYPGWEAQVDGRPAPLLEADYILRAVPVPAGKHAIVLRFRPRSFLLGLAVSLASLAAAGLCLAATRPRRNP
ncbi:MAG: hypothetical protein DMG07_25660, partial [Acidobacteria bacterium]